MTAAEFGATAWGRVWLRTIESTAASAPNAQLPHARRLARGGAVTLTDVSAGRVDAEVVVKQKSYAITVDVPRWDADALVRVREVLGGAGLSDGGASGDLPDALVAQLQGAGIVVAATPAECGATCACTGRRAPCLHHLATVYALVQLIDEEPALAVRLRSDGSVAVGSAGPGSRGRRDWIALAEVDPESFYG
ncbi:hypothetical protein [Rhodococcus maanshanensis]|uniref:SWIM-type domain-containing protein n=1 Tax=Rhodococcus maanshanensis TaxID=183556 RepID=A0A1H7MTA0_9NOCA|nr:hypothetical protein [Rhodococcus maanshanensis]SEL14433.1 hypothetical protein SAMN05444583_106138 [Rhodococcus maanshanensis]